MPYRSFDIFQKLPDGNHLWIETSETLEEARKRLLELVVRDSGIYGVYDGILGKFVIPFPDGSEL
ncbi:MAG TPA: hypothetical protein VIY66_08180 [Candidatus Acidoferrales bacterium]